MSHTNNNTSLFGNLFGSPNPTNITEKQKSIQTLASAGVALSMFLIVCTPAPWKWIGAAIQTCFLCGVTYFWWKTKHYSVLPFILSIVAAIMMIALGISGTFKV